MDPIEDPFAEFQDEPLGAAGGAAAPANDDPLSAAAAGDDEDPEKQRADIMANLELHGGGDGNGDIFPAGRDELPGRNDQQQPQRDNHPLAGDAGGAAAGGRAAAAGAKAGAGGGARQIADGGDESKGAAPAADKARGAFEVVVTDPEKKGEGMYAYVSYKVVTKVETSPGKYNQSSVVRRYSDFAWLRKRLLAGNPGLLIPPLPGKAIMGRFSPVFVDLRRRGLELFFARVARHSVLHADENVKLFLHGSQEFHDERDGVTNIAQAPKKRGFFDRLSEAAQSAIQAVGGGPEREKTREDLACEGIGVYADSLEASVGAVHTNLSTLSKRNRELATQWFEFGLACTLLGQYESEQEDQLLGNAFARLGNCADRLSVLETQRHDSQVLTLEEPVADFVRTVGAVKEMLASRSEALSSYNAALTSLESASSRLEKVRGRPGKENKALQVEREVEQAQARVDNELRNLQSVTQKVLAETARFRREKRVDFKRAMTNFVKLQIDHARKVQSAWQSVLPEIESLPFE